MAFQRPFVISLKRPDSRNPWGFQVFGGKEYGAPHVVQTVGPDSMAEQCGLRAGDEVIQVGRVNVQDLSLAQLQELLIRCGNKIEMFVIREDLLTPRKGKEPPVVKAVVHNPYNSPLQLYSTENIADTLARQTEVLTEGHVSTEEDEGPENLSFKQKSEVFKLLEEQARQGSPPLVASRSSPQSAPVKKPSAAPPPPPPPKPKHPPSEQLLNGVDAHQQQSQLQHKRVEFQSTTEKVHQYHYQQEPVQQTRTYQQTSSQLANQQQAPHASYQHFEDYQALNQSNYRPSQGQTTIYQNQQPQNFQSQVTFQPQHSQGPQSQIPYKHQQSQGRQLAVAHSQQQPQGHQSPVAYSQQQSQGPHSPVPFKHQQSQGPQSPVAYQQQQSQGHQFPTAGYQQSQSQQQKQQHQTHSQQSKQKSSQPSHKAPVAVSNAEFKIGPPPPPRAHSSNHQQKVDNMTAIYRQQYEQHLQQQLQQQQYFQNNFEDDSRQKPAAHLIKEPIFENNTASGTPITYKAPPAAPPKPTWPPQSPQHNDQQWGQGPIPSSPTSVLKANMASVWPPRQPSVRELPKTGFNPAAVREQGTGRRCVWPPPRDDESRSGRTTPQSPSTGRRIQWNPSPSPPTNRRNVFGTSHSPARRRDIAWPPPSPQATPPRDAHAHRPSPRLSRKARFDDYIKEHASNNVPSTYRAPPGTQHVEYC